MTMTSVSSVFCQYRCLRNQQYQHLLDYRFAVYIKGTVILWNYMLAKSLHCTSVQDPPPLGPCRSHQDGHRNHPGSQVC